LPTSDVYHSGRQTYSHADRQSRNKDDNYHAVYWSHIGIGTLEFKNVSLNEGFLDQKTNVNRKISLHFGFEMLKKAGNFDNLRIAAGLIKGNYRGYVFHRFGYL
jgi:hypothetical protein